MFKHRTSLVLASFFALALLAGFAGSAAAAAGMVINPQAGVTWTNYSFDEDESIDDSARTGWALGGTLRFGGPLYIAPGLYYQSTGFEATGVDSVTLGTFTEAVGVDAFHIPVYVGLNVGGATGAAATGLRVYAGPTVTIVTAVGDNEFGIEKDDYESTIFGGTLGAGFDLTSITFDVNYEIGFSEVFKDAPEGAGAKQNVLRGLVGLKF